MPASGTIFPCDAFSISAKAYSLIRREITFDINGGGEIEHCALNRGGDISESTAVDLCHNFYFANVSL